MRRSADFGATVRFGRRAVQSDIVIHKWRLGESGDRNDAPSTPLVGLIIAKSVGSAVQRHRVARRLRHVAYSVLTELEPADQVVIRALPGSGQADSACLKQQLRTGLRTIRRAEGADR